MFQKDVYWGLYSLIYIFFVIFIIIDTTYFASHADDNTSDFIKKTTEVLQELETVLKKLFLWFTENEMMANADKCHLLSSVEDRKIEINGFTVKNSYYKKLSEVQFDDHIKFDFYIEKLCKKANRKLHALARVSIYTDLSKKRMLMSVFFDLNVITYGWFGCVIAEINLS